MMLVKGDEKMEAGVLPDTQDFVDMGKYNDELKQAGALIMLDGFHPSSKGARVSFSNGQTTVMNGPFPNPSELVEGFWIIQVASMEDAIAWAKRVPFKAGVIEIRQIQEMSDFPEDVQQAIGSAGK